LETSALDERQHRYLDHVRTAGDHLLELVNEVLEIARIESSGSPLPAAPVRLIDVVNNAVDIVATHAQARRISITVTQEDPTREAWAVGDAQRLLQVLLNLLTNAIKYNHEAGHVRVRVGRSAGEHVALVVADDGPGIRPELLARLFTPFDRLGAERTTVAGTGLGLAISKAFLEAMGGTLEVQSTPGSGTAFTLVLHATGPAAPSVADPEAPLAATEPTERRLVLSIEDNEANIELFRAIFAQRPELMLVTARQAEDGIDMAGRYRPDLILLDLDLPDLSGQQTMARLQADPRTAAIPLVIVTADASPAQAERMRAQGAMAYVTKPVGVTELLRVVDAATLAPAG